MRRMWKIIGQIKTNEVALFLMYNKTSTKDKSNLSLKENIQKKEDGTDWTVSNNTFSPVSLYNGH